MKTQIIVPILSLSLLFSCSEDSLCLVGDGQVNQYELNISTINAVDISGPVNLKYTQGETQSITILAESQMYHDLDHKVRDGVLSIGYEENIGCFETDYGVWINITAPVIKKITTSGVSKIITNGPIEQNSIKIVTSGTAEVALTGAVTNQTIISSGELIARNFHLSSASTKVDISGSADLEIACSDNLNIDVEGSATIKYTGHPAINKNVRGELSLIDYNE